MAKQIDYPADTVDSNGKAWKTVGENIRNGAKEIPMKKVLLEALDMVYPVGSVYVGEVPDIFHEFGTWVSFNEAKGGQWGLVYGQGGKVKVVTPGEVMTVSKKELEEFQKLIPDYNLYASIQVPIMKRIQ